MLSGTIGIVHFASSIIALITGTMVLLYTKGTITHKRIGYVYTFSMLVVLVTSFFLYNLHGTFGILHWLAVLSSISLLAGMLPILFKYPKDYISYHFSFMYWSVIGLYCAFAAETFTRIPFYLELGENLFPVFYSLVGISAAIVGGIGSFYFRKYKELWFNRFSKNNQN